MSSPTSSIDIPLRNGGFGQTGRKDTWWVEPLLVFLGFSAFIVYSTWAALQNAHYTLPGTGYLSPMYSPILWTPGGFRLTCYYYRGAYYKAFWADPPSCTVGEPRKSYWGEATFPLVI